MADFEVVGMSASDALAWRIALGFKEEVVDVSSADLQSLFTSPKLLVPAPGVGKFILPFWTKVDYLFGTTAYTGTGDNGVFRSWILYDDIEVPTGTDISAMRRVFAQTESAITYSPADLFASDVFVFRALAENKSVVLKSEGDYADGDGIAQVTICYRIENLLTNA